MCNNSVQQYCNIIYLNYEFPNTSYPYERTNINIAKLKVEFDVKICSILSHRSFNHKNELRYVNVTILYAHDHIYARGVNVLLIFIANCNEGC